MVTASAPGKIILFGEHAVVYGRPALAVPVTQVRATATVAESADGQVWIDAPDISLRATLDSLPGEHPLADVIRSTFSALGVSTPPPFTLQIESTIPVASGLGSGAAVSAAVIRALSAFLGQPLSDEQVSALAYEAEKLYHGTPSGIDNTVITYARPVYFVKGQPIETFQVGAPFTIVIGDTGIASPTKETVDDVRKAWQADPERYERIFDKVGEIARRARTAIEAGDVAALGALMDENHALLQAMDVSSAELDRLVETARKCGASGAKLSGSGRGGNAIALVEKEKAAAVAAALMRAGAKRTLVTTVSP